MRRRRKKESTSDVDDAVDLQDRRSLSAERDIYSAEFEADAVDLLSRRSPASEGALEDDLNEAGLDMRRRSEPTHLTSSKPPRTEKALRDSSDRSVVSARTADDDKYRKRRRPRANSSPPAIRPERIESIRPERIEFKYSRQPRKRYLIPVSMLSGAALMLLMFYVFLPCFQADLSLSHCIDPSLSADFSRFIPFSLSLPNIPDAANYKDLLVMLSNVRENIGTMWEDAERPGKMDEFRNRSVLYPVVMIPGFTGSRLEMWQGTECMQNNFREHVWGGTAMLKHMTRPECWFRHMKLDQATGGDPIDLATGNRIRVRPAEGFAAADYFFEGYYVWGPMIQNLADIGYDAKSMVLQGYDWRLRTYLNEKRDMWYTRLKHRIESLVAVNGQPAVVATHSFGSVLFVQFLQWMEKTDPHWTRRNIHAQFNIAGPLLGLPKAATAYLSGESGEYLVSPLLSQLLGFFHRIFDKTARKQLLRTWGSIGDMLPTGGEAVWPDTLIRVRDVTVNESESVNFGITEVIALLKSQMLNYDAMKGTRSSILNNPLPSMPNFYCVYGTGKPTELDFEYLKNGDEYYFDLSHDNVISYTNGDGTVPLRGLAYPCHLWKKKKWHNPGKARVVIREKKHEPQSFASRGGVSSGDHLDIMGNHGLISDLLRIVTGETLEEEVHSDMSEILGGIDERLGADFIENGPLEGRN